MKVGKQSESTSAEPDASKLVEQYCRQPVLFTGTADALYERHLVFDNVLEPARIGARQRFEAAARSVRDVLSQRWIQTETTYERENVKRVYYLSMDVAGHCLSCPRTPVSGSIPRFSQLRTL